MHYLNLTLGCVMVLKHVFSYHLTLDLNSWSYPATISAIDDCNWQVIIKPRDVLLESRLYIARCWDDAGSLFPGYKLVTNVKLCGAWNYIAMRLKLCNPALQTKENTKSFLAKPLLSDEMFAFAHRARCVSLLSFTKCLYPPVKQLILEPLFDHCLTIDTGHWARFGVSIRLHWELWFGISIRLHWEGYDSALALGCTGPKS